MCSPSCYIDVDKEKELFELWYERHACSYSAIPKYQLFFIFMDVAGMHVISDPDYKRRPIVKGGCFDYLGEPK